VPITDVDEAIICDILGCLQTDLAAQEDGWIWHTIDIKAARGQETAAFLESLPK
jgi:hypothetical protein